MKDLGIDRNASSGLQTAKGFYRKNVKEGVWKYFNPTAGNIILQVNYTNDDKNGPFMVFADDGTIVGKGRYFNGELDTMSWETENKANGKGDYEHYRIWGRNDIKEKIEKFHDEQIIKEFQSAVEQKKDYGIVLVWWRTSDVENTLGQHVSHR